MQQTKTYRELSDQYNALQITLSCCEHALERIRPFYEVARPAHIVVAGCGSSYSLSRAVANNARLLLGVSALAVAGGDLMLHTVDYDGVFSERTLLITLSRSGSTHELLYSIEKLRAQYPQLRVLSLVCKEGSRVTAASDAALEFPWAFDESVCQTRSVTNLFGGALYLLARLAGNDTVAEALKALARDGNAFLQTLEPGLEPVARLDWANAMLLCDGESFGVAEEAALAFNEIAYTPSSCKHVLDVRHGPIVLVGPDTLVLARFTKEGFSYQEALVRELLARHAVVVAISDEPLPALEGVAGQFAFGAPLSGAVAAMLLLPAAQLLSCGKACILGKNPDSPEGLDAWISLSK